MLTDSLRVHASWHRSVYASVLSLPFNSIHLPPPADLLPLLTPGTIHLPLFVCLCHSGRQPVSVSVFVVVVVIVVVVSVAIVAVFVDSKLARFTFLIKFHLICAFPSLLLLLVLLLLLFC